MMQSSGTPGSRPSRYDYSVVGQQDHAPAMYESELQENLVGPSAGAVVPVAKSVPMMQITAPATLPEDYEFAASIGENRSITVKVPAGGVEEGQTFAVPMPVEIQQSMMTAGIHIPVGHWRDGVFECFRHGVCHPHCWTAWCCPLLAAGQVSSRLRYTWYGSPGQTAAETNGAFQKIFLATVLYAVAYVSTMLTFIYLDPNTYTDDHAPMVPLTRAAGLVGGIYDLIKWGYFIAVTCILVNLRSHVRAQYAITAPDYEDCLLSTFCHCCVAAQLLRHTTDYDVYPSTCCTERGIPRHAPSIV